MAVAHLERKKDEKCPLFSLHYKCYCLQAAITDKMLQLKKNPE